ncbi:MAG: hypothetical protein DRR19_12265 [Candidatus Parabeggiatoa sp. nov. 1]|nr:MAG: hypothetical protein DRR19_12265 [Gammaproteobacteria bacterium]
MHITFKFMIFLSILFRLGWWARQGGIAQLYDFWAFWSSSSPLRWVRKTCVHRVAISVGKKYLKTCASVLIILIFLDAPIQGQLWL